MNWGKNWCILFAPSFLAALAIWSVLDYLHTGQVDFRFVLTGVLGFAIGATIANRRLQKVKVNQWLISLDESDRQTKTERTWIDCFTTHDLFFSCISPLLRRFIQCYFSLTVNKIGENVRYRANDFERLKNKSLAS